MGSLFKFLLLTHVVSWSLWIAAAAISGGTYSPPAGLAGLSILLFLLGVIAPSMVALALTELTDGRTGVLALLRRIIEFPKSVRWYLFAVTYFVAIKLAVALVYRAATGEYPPFSQTPWFIMAVAVVFSTPVQAGEEIGWRGYALPRLAKQLGLAPASIVLGVIWAFWHLPLFFIPGSDTYGQSFPVYVLAVTALSVAMAWLYWRTNGSLFLMMLMHAAVNNTNIVSSSASASANPFALKTPLVAWLTAALLWICAVYFLVRMRRATLERGGRALNNSHEIASAASV